MKTDQTWRMPGGWMPRLIFAGRTCLFVGFVMRCHALAYVLFALVDFSPVLQERYTFDSRYLDLAYLE